MQARAVKQARGLGLDPSERPGLAHGARPGATLSDTRGLLSLIPRVNTDLGKLYFCALNPNGEPSGRWREMGTIKPDSVFAWSFPSGTGGIFTVTDTEELDTTH